MARRGKKKSLARRIRRLVFLASATAAIVRYAMSRRPKTQRSETRPAEWAPLRTAPTTPSSSAASTSGSAALKSSAASTSSTATSPLPAWVEPVDGACPATHPVKGKTKSGIYHVAGGRFYDSTVPERCYRDTAAAEADGMRASQR
jgi:hypothetical protein